MITTPTILDELRNRPSKQRADMLLSTGRILEESPDSHLTTQIEEAARRTGDLNIMSDTDIQLLALALTREVAGDTVVVVSSDLAVLNTAEELGLAFLDPHKRMKNKIIWMRKCPACGHAERKISQVEECPICGTVMIRVPAKRKPVHSSE